MNCNGDPEHAAHTYSLLRTSLVSFDFQLQFVDQILQTCNILAVFLSLDESRE